MIGITIMKEILLLGLPTLAIVIVKLLVCSNSNKKNTEGPFDCYVHGGR